MIYEAYNETEAHQFATEQPANDYAALHNLQVREAIILSFPFVKNEPTKLDWLNLEQELYKNPNVFGKALQSTGNGFAFLSKVFADGKTIYAHQNALLMAINLLIPNLVYPYSSEDIEFINQALTENNFTIQL